MIVPNFRPPLSAPPADVDVAIVGAGAAGIAAARLCVGAGLRVAVLEARDRVGGRAVTASFGGHPLDLGAHWLHAGRMNPLVRLARHRGERLYRAPGGGPVVVEGRFESGADRRRYGQAFEQADLAFARAARAEADAPISASLPPLGRWGGAIRATMALISGRPLSEVSVQDFPSEEFGDNYFIRGGYGAYLARLASGLPVRLGCPVSAIDWSGPGATLQTPHGTVSARAAVITAPAPVLNAGAIRFTPPLPDAAAEAIAAFLPGAYEHVVLNWPGAPFRRPDRLAKIVTRRASYGLLARIEDAPFHYLELDYAAVAGAGSRDALARLARDFLRNSLGAVAVRQLRVLAVTDWLADPFSRSAWAVVPPGRVGSREELSRPVGQRLWFAGEANSRPLWGTVGGAWAEGERAAAEIVQRLKPAGAA